MTLRPGGMLRTAIALFLALIVVWLGFTNVDKNIATPSAESSDMEDGGSLLNVVLVASVDGSFRLLDRTTGRVRRSIASKDRALAPLVKISQPSNSDLEYTSQYIIEPQSGDIYILASPPETSPLRRFPFSMSQLVDMSPFTFEDLLLVGEKETFELTIDLATGNFRTSSGANSWREKWLKSGDFGSLTREQVENMGFSGAQEVSIYRTEYRVAAHKRTSDKETLVQNLSFSTYGPHAAKNQLQAAYTKTKDNVYVQSLPQSGEIKAFKAGAVRWATKLPSPMIAAFDVMDPPGVHIPEDFVALLQPRRRISTIMPRLKEADLPHLGSVYIGLVEKTCSLFAMSSERFPLIAVGGGGRRRLDASSPSARSKQKQPTKASPPSAESSDKCTEQRRLVGMRRVEDEDGSATRRSG
ncbi:hypothetical protein HMN09_00289100 [Mycena chlorophos]|uniref:Uncharacterized protein n=1 Tax=Mycena chlorophos TaxID=658473 RepID=A0A8H6WJQ6_MYCCL|nr:hypothetical protein HMN09_00289100 [Mycena chlorophos]